MDALKNGLSVILLTLVPALAGCSGSLPYSGSDRAIALYHDSLGAQGALSFRRNDAERREKESATNSADSVPSVLTVDGAIGLAKKNSARLIALQAAAAAADAMVVAANRHANPQFQLTQIRLNQILNGVPQVRTALRFFPDKPGAIAADVAEARARHAQALANLRNEELNLEVAVRWAFDDVALLDAEIAAARDVARIRQSINTEVQRRLSMAESTLIDQALADLSALEADADVSAQEARRREALGTLFDLLGVSPQATTEIQGEPPLAWPPAELPAERILVEYALRRSPEVAVAAARIDATDARAYAERAKQYPWFSYLEFGYQFAPNTIPGLGWTLQAGVDLPIFDTNRNGVIAANSAKTAAMRAFEAEVERVTREVRAQMRAVQLAESLVTQYRDRSMPIVEKAGQDAKKALDSNKIDTLRALTIEEKRAVVQLHLLRLIRRYRTAMSELRRTSGNVNSAVTP